MALLIPIFPNTKTKTGKILTLMIVSIIAIEIWSIEANSSSSSSSELIYLPPAPANNTRVRMTNKVGPNLVLTVHCKSKDDDLGVHELPPDTSYEFHFRPHFLFERTLFFCLMEWPGFSHYFDIYRQARDQRRCHSDCCWNIVPTGPCDSNSGQCFPWNPDDHDRKD